MSGSSGLLSTATNQLGNSLQNQLTGLGQRSTNDFGRTAAPIIGQAAGNFARGLTPGGPSDPRLNAVPGGPLQMDLSGFFGPEIQIGHGGGNPYDNPGFDYNGMPIGGSDPGFNGGPSFGGGKGGQTGPVFQPSPGIDPSPIQGNGGGSSAPGLSHIKDYGPQVDQMQQYVQSMQQLIQQMNSKF